MSPVATRIYERIKALTKERDDLNNQIKKITQDKDSVKKSIHHTEMAILSEGAISAADGYPDIRFANELRELKKEKQTLQHDDDELKTLHNKYANLIKTIDSYQFWMHYADTSDIAHQQAAEKKVFG